jgi:hypothetical protein
MRLIIETDEKTITAAAPISTEPGRGDAIDGGAPAASLFQSVTAAAPARTETGNFGDGIDGGQPPEFLVQALKSAASPARSTTGSESSDGGAARNT